MRLELEGEAMARRSDVRRHIERRASMELARYGGYVDELRMRVIERASPRHRYHCGISLTIAHDDGGRTNVGTAANGNDVFRLVDAVLADASSVVGEEIVRGLVAQEEAGVRFAARHAAANTEHP